MYLQLAYLSTNGAIAVYDLCFECVVARCEISEGDAVLVLWSDGPFIGIPSGDNGTVLSAAQRSHLMQG